MASPSHCHGRGFAEQGRRQQHRDEGLGLQHHRGHARRHAKLHAREQQAELSHAEHEPVSRHQRPPHIARRLDEQQERQRSREKAQRAKHERRELWPAPIS